MQLSLALLELPTPTPSAPSRQLRDAKAHAEALIAKAAQPANQTEATDE